MNFEFKQAMRRAVRTLMLSMILGLGIGLVPLAFSRPVDEDLSHLPFTEAYRQAVALLEENYPLGEWKGIDWEQSYHRYLPEIAVAEANGDLAAFYHAFGRFAFRTIQDGHTSLSAIHPEAEALGVFRDLMIGQSGGSYGLTLATLDDGRVVVASVRPGEPAELSGMRVGDEILSWNGAPVDEAFAGIEPFLMIQGIATSEGHRRMAEISIGRGKPGSLVDVLIRRASDGVPLRVRLDAMDDPLGNLDDRVLLAHTAPTDELFQFRWLNGGIAHLAITALMPELPDEELQSFEEIYEAGMAYVDTFRNYLTAVTAAGGKSLIIDLRGNAGGADILGAMMVSALTRDSWFYTQNFYKNENGEWVNEDDPFAICTVEPEGEPLYEGEIVVLVDNNTISAGEGFAYHLQKLPNVRVMGTTRTNGSFAWVGSRIILPGGLVYRFPSGPSMDEHFQILIDTDLDNKGGVYPDLAIPRTLNRVMREASGEDVELATAVDEMIRLRAAYERRQVAGCVCPTILAFEVNGQQLPTEITRPAANGVPAEAEILRIHVPAGEPVDIRILWDWRKEPSGFTLIQGKLPDGLALDRSHGWISGLPGTRGDFLFQISVKDWRGRGYQWVHLSIE